MEPETIAGITKIASYVAVGTVGSIIGFGVGRLLDSQCDRTEDGKTIRQSRPRFDNKPSIDYEAKNIK